MVKSLDQDDTPGSMNGVQIFKQSLNLVFSIIFIQNVQYSYKMLKIPFPVRSKCHNSAPTNLVIICILNGSGQITWVNKSVVKKSEIRQLAEGLHP
jgi:hypothetical protein